MSGESKRTFTDMDVILGVHTTVAVLSPALALLLAKMALGFMLKSESQEVLEERRLTENRCERKCPFYKEGIHGAQTKARRTPSYIPEPSKAKGQCPAGIWGEDEAEPDRVRRVETRTILDHKLSQ